MLNLNSNSTLMDAVAGLEDAKQLEARELDFLSDTETDSDQSQQDVSYMTSQAHLNQIKDGDAFIDLKKVRKANLKAIKSGETRILDLDTVRDMTFKRA